MAVRYRETTAEAWNELNPGPRGKSAYEIAVEHGFVGTEQEWIDSLSAGNAVSSVNGQTGAVVLTKSDVGLGSVDNTTDLAKPISTATQTALDLKAPIANPTFTGTVGGITKTMVGLGNVDNTSDVNKPISSATQAALNLKAPLANPTFTGTVGGITKSMVGLANVDNTSDASKPVSTATQTALDLKAPLASPTFTGTVSGITKAMVGLGNVDNTADTAKPVSTAAQVAMNNLDNRILILENNQTTNWNFLINGSLETWQAGDAVPYAFSTTWATGTGQTGGKNTGVVRTGTSSYALTFPTSAAANDNRWLQSDILPCVPGQWVEATSYVRADVAGRVQGRLSLQFGIDDSVNFLNGDTTQVDGQVIAATDTVWTKLTTRAQVPVGKTKMRVLTQMQKIATGTVATMYVDDMGLRIIEVPDAGSMPVPTIFPFSQSGTVSVKTGTQRLYNDTGRTLTIQKVRATLGTAPTGATFIADINKNGTTIFTTTGNRPTIAISGNTATGVPDVTSWADGEYLTVDIDQVGSTVAGADLVVQVQTI